MQILFRLLRTPKLDVTFITTFKRVSCWNAEEYSTRNPCMPIWVYYVLYWGCLLLLPSCYPGCDTLHCTAGLGLPSDGLETSNMFAQQQAALFKTLPVALLAVDSDNAKALLQVIMGNTHLIVLFQHALHVYRVWGSALNYNEEYNCNWSASA